MAIGNSTRSPGSASRTFTAPLRPNASRVGDADGGSARARRHRAGEARERRRGEHAFRPEELDGPIVARPKKSTAPSVPRRRCRAGRATLTGAPSARGCRARRRARTARASAWRDTRRASHEVGVRALHLLDRLQDHLRVARVDAPVAIEIVHPPVAVVVHEHVRGVAVHVPALPRAPAALAAPRVVLRRAEAAHHAHVPHRRAARFELVDHELELVHKRLPQHQVLGPDVPAGRASGNRAAGNAPRRTCPRSPA